MRASSGRITLRPAKRADLAHIEQWYEEAAATVRSGRHDPDDTLERRASEAGDRLLVVALKGEDEPVGLLEYCADDPARAWLRTAFVAIVPGRRGFGYGSEAVRALEGRAATSRGVTSFLAEIDPRNGLALYFWLRLGYRPAHKGEVFWRAPNEGGIIAMIRASREASD
jgi:RimJ/RimL family protein N-acetyltransferase